MEAVLRVAGYSPTYVNPLNSFHGGDKQLGWVGIPSFTGRFHKKDFDVLISMNEKGFRKLQSKIQPSPGARSVMFLGDSFTWGWGVSQGNVFTDYLQNELGPGFRVINCGVNSYGTVQEKILLQQLLPVDKPIAVGVMFCFNDFDDNVNRSKLDRPYCTLESGKVVLHNSPVAHPIGGIFSRLMRNSYAVSFLAYYSNQLNQVIKDNIPGHAANRGLKSPAPSIELKMIMEHTLSEMKATSQSNGARLFVVYIPLAAELDSSYISVYLPAMREICAKLEIDFLNPTECMRAVYPETGPKGEPLYFTNDGHWTAEGHRIAALVIRDYIQSLNLP